MFEGGAFGSRDWAATSPKRGTKKKRPPNLGEAADMLWNLYLFSFWNFYFEAERLSLR
jgi:hypothetical protein